MEVEGFRQHSPLRPRRPYLSVRVYMRVGFAARMGMPALRFPQTRTVGCSVYIDGAFSYGDYARDGDHHDVNCLRTLSNDYYPNGVQGRSL